MSTNCLFVGGALNGKWVNVEHPDEPYYRFEETGFTTIKRVQYKPTKFYDKGRTLYYVYFYGEVKQEPMKELLKAYAAMVNTEKVEY